MTIDRIGTVLLTLALLAGACTGEPGQPAAGPEGDGQASGEAGQGLVVVTSTFPAAWLAERIAPGAQLAHLASGGQGVHDLTLSPGDRTDLTAADVVLFVGEVGFQPQVEEAVSDAEGEVVSFAEVAGDRLLPVPGRGGEADDHGHEGDDGHEGEDGHDDEGLVDPHVWFEPAIMQDVAEAVGEAFAAADPDRAGAYRANAEAAATELAEVRAYADERLGGDCGRDAAIVSHEAYQYLLEPHGHDQVGISGAGGHAEATPQRLAELTERIEARGITAVLVEPLEGRRDAEALAREAGVELIEIHPLGSVDDATRSRGLPAMLTEQIDAFAEALDCP